MPRSAGVAIGAVIAVLAVLLALQSVRLHRAQRDLASAPPPSVGETPNRDDGGPLGVLGKVTERPVAAKDAAQGGGRAEPQEEGFTERLLNEAIEALLEEPEEEGAEGTASNRGRGKRKGLHSAADTTAAKGKKRGGEDDSKRARAVQRSKRLLNQARDAIHNGDFEAAQALLEESLEQDTKNRQAYRGLAQLQSKLGLSQEAMQTYRDWIEAMPGDALPHYMLATAYEQVGLDAEAYQELLQFSQISAGDLPSYPMTASLMRRLGMRAEEGATLEAWAQVAPESPDAHRALADYYRRRGNYGAAVSEYEEVAALMPGNVNARMNLANALERVGLHGDAQAQYLAALEMRPNDVAIRLQWAASLRNAGDPYGAIDAYQGVIDLEPGSREARTAWRQINRIERQLNKPVKPK